MATFPRTPLDLPGPPSVDTTNSEIAELIRLQKFAQKVGASLDLEEIIERIVSEVAATLGCVEINIFLHDRERSELDPRCTRGLTSTLE